MNDINNSFKKKIVKNLYKVLSLLIAFLTSSWLWYYNISPYWKVEYKGYMTLFLVGIMYCAVYWIFAKMYQAQKIGIYRLTELTYFQMLSFAIADVTLFIESVIWFHGFERLKIWTYLFGFAFQMVTIVLIIFVLNRLHARYDKPRKVLIIYGDNGYKSLVRKIKAKKRRYRIMACVPDTNGFDDVKNQVDECESLYLYKVNDDLKKTLVLYCDKISKDIYLTLDIDDLVTMGFDISHTFDTPFIRTKRSDVKWYYPFVKRTMDIVCSGVALIILSPLLIIVAIAIKAYDGGPVFFLQKRVTVNHKEFMIYKFRSMIVDAEANGMRRATTNDDRITPVGKIIRATRIDELPQLLNIIKGDMSIVGPRPERVELDEAYTNKIPEFSSRLKVRAGLTGYAQVFGKYNTTPEDKLKLDLLYINQRSVKLDLKLILYTVKIMFIPESTEGFEEDETKLEDIK